MDAEKIGNGAAHVLSEIPLGIVDWVIGGVTGFWKGFSTGSVESYESKKNLGSAVTAVGDGVNGVVKEVSKRYEEVKNNIETAEALKKSAASSK